MSHADRGRRAPFTTSAPAITAAVTEKKASAGCFAGFFGARLLRCRAERDHSSQPEQDKVIIQAVILDVSVWCILLCLRFRTREEKRKENLPDFLFCLLFQVPGPPASRVFTAMRSRPPLARREDRDRWALRLQRPPGRIRLNGSQRRDPLPPPRSSGLASPAKTLSCGARGHANGPTPSSFSHTVSSPPLCPSRTFLPTGCSLVLPPPSVTLWPIDPTGGEIVSGSALPPPANHSEYALLLKPNNYAQQGKETKKQNTAACFWWSLSTWNLIIYPVWEQKNEKWFSAEQCFWF